MAETVSFGIDSIDLPIVLLSVAIILFVSWMLRTPRNLPPGPWGWPVIGYLPNLLISLSMSGLHPEELFRNFARKYGPVFCFNILGQTVVVLNSHDCIKDALHNPQLTNRPKSDVLEDFGLSEGLVQASGEPWKQQRRFTLTTLRGIGVGKRSFEAKIDEEAVALTEEINKLEGNSFDPRRLFTNATSNIICSVVFGKRYEYTDSKFKILLNILDENVKAFGAGAMVLFVPIAKYLQPRNYQTLKGNVLTLTAFLRDIVNEHLVAHDPDNPKDYIDVYLNEIELNKKLSRHHSAVNDKNLVSTITALFGAGTETTSTTLRWALMYMMKYPKIQDRIQKELDSVTARNRLPKMADKDDIPFTCATLLEIQRIVTVTPLGVLHSSAEDTSINGFTVPKGSFLLANLWAVHHDPDIWQDPEEFNPERFLDKDGRVLHKEELIPFATGRRICIGEHLAKMEIFIFFTHLLHHFTFKKPEDSPPLSFKGEPGLVKSAGAFLTQALKRE